MSEEEESNKNESVSITMPEIKIGENLDDDGGGATGEDILSQTIGLYVKKEFFKFEKNILKKLEEIVEKLNNKESHEEYNPSSFKVDYGNETNLLHKGFKSFFFSVLFLLVCCLVNISCIILLNGILWMEIPILHCVFLTMMSCVAIFIVMIMNMLLYYIIRICFIKRKKIDTYSKLGGK